MFQRSIEQQIALNRSRTPSQRLESLCDLLDFARSIAPVGVKAEQRRQRAESARQFNREQWRVRCRQFLATQRANPETGA